MLVRMFAFIIFIVTGCQEQAAQDESFHYGYPGGYVPDAVDTGSNADTAEDTSQETGDSTDSGQDSDDTGPPDTDTGPIDNDGDGFAEEVDCNDRNSTVHPGADEDPSGTGYGDGIDNDCDGTADEGTYLSDDDGDSYTEAEGDCDDANADVSPGEFEVDDDGVDNDCSGTTDDPSACCPDEDGDGYGATEGCVGLNDDGTCDEGYVVVYVDYDCDDDNYTVNPGRSDSAYDEGDADCDGEEE